MQDTKDFIIFSHDITNPGFGQYPGSRSIEELVSNGFVLLDKWSGPTSRDVSAAVKNLFSLKKAAHAGTLDPKTTGVLPILLENACKVMPALQKQDKEYVGVMKLHKDVGDEQLAAAVKKFVGEITQLPPVRSAVARRERKRKVHYFDILERDSRNVLFRIGCEAGTYVRVVCHSIGKEIGGAHMTELRRTKVGNFDEKQLVRMQDLADAYADWKEGSEKIRELVLPVESCISHLGKIIIKDSAVASVAAGSPLFSQGISRMEKGINAGDLVAVMTLKGELVALAKAAVDADKIGKRRMLAAKTDRVIIRQGVYPKMRA